MKDDFDAEDTGAWLRTLGAKFSRAGGERRYHDRRKLDRWLKILRAIKDTLLALQALAITIAAVYMIVTGQNPIALMGLAS